MSGHGFLSGLWTAFQTVRPARVTALLLASLVAALVSDWAREERVIFPPPLPKFLHLPARR